MSEMSLDQALRILSRVHTRDHHEMGFTIEAGARPEPYLNDTSRDEYCDAWAVVRKHLHLPFEPELRS